MVLVQAWRTLTIALVIGLLLSFSTVVGAQQKTINILMEAVPDTNFVVELLPEFEAATGIRVNVEIVNYADMREKLIPQLLSRRGSYDVIVVDNYWVGEFTQAGWLEDLGPYLARTPDFDTSVYLPSMFNMVGQVDGTVYMLPFYNYAMALIYRTDVLEDPALQAEYRERFGKELALPETLQEYVELAKFLTRDTDGDGRVDFYGAAMQGLRPDPIAMEWLNYLYALGGDFFDEAGNIRINDAIAVEALTLYKEMITQAAPPGSTGFGFDEAYSVMAQGKAFSYITYNWMLPQLNNPEESAVVGKVDIAPVPGGASLNGGWGWAIPTSSPDKDAAWQFLTWVESFEIAKKRALLGGSPTRSDVFRDPEVVAKYPHYPRVEEILANTIYIPIIEKAPQLIEVLGRELSLAVSADKDPQRALDDVARDIRAFIR